MSVLIICEKPSVAKTVALALGAAKQKDGYLSGDGLLVSWCIGHLISMADAGSYDERYKKWPSCMAARVPNLVSTIFLPAVNWQVSGCPSLAQSL